MMWAPVVVVLGVAVASAFLAEAISWLLIYRTDSYKNLKEKVEILTKKRKQHFCGVCLSLAVDSEKEKTTTVLKKKIHERKLSALEEQLKEKSKDMAMAKLKSTAFVAVVLLGVFAMLNRWFDGTRVARLPFEPPRFMRSMTHRNLPGEDYRDCSMAFLYFLCSMSIRPNVQKALGFAPPRGAPNPFAPPTPPVE
jgi:hypothetical protein